MKIEISNRKLGLQLAFFVLVGTVTWLVAPPFLGPLSSRWADQKIAKWERLQDDGKALMKSRKYEEAEVSFRAALSYAEKLLVQPSREGSSAFGLAGVLLLQNRFDEARSYFERCLLIREELDGEPSSSQCRALIRLVDVCLETSDLDAALDYARRAVAIREAQDLSPNPELPVALDYLARVYLEQEDFTAALPIRERIVQLTEATQLSGARDLGIAYYRQGVMHNALKQFEAAEELYLKSLDVLEESVKPDAKCFVALIREYARLLDVTGRANKASRLRASKGRAASP